MTYNEEAPMRDDRDYATTAYVKEETGAIEEMDRELERFDVSLERLEKTLGPVSSQYASAIQVSEPRPEPATQLRGQTDRLRVQLGRLDRIMNEIDL